MKFILFPALIIAMTLAPARAAEPPAPEKPGLMKRLWQSIPMPKFGGKGKAPVWNDLRLDLIFNPPAVKLAETRRVEVTMHLKNVGKKLVQLEFPTSQRIDVIVKNPAGRVLERWSDDQAFSDDPTVVTINPGERLEYTAAIATREMTAGQRYTVEGFFPRYPELRVVKTLTPQ